MLKSGLQLNLYLCSLASLPSISNPLIINEEKNNKLILAINGLSNSYLFNICYKFDGCCDFISLLKFKNSLVAIVAVA